MKNYLLIWFIVIKVFITLGYSFAQKTVVIKSDDIEQISLIRLSDIYSILPQLDIYTIERYRHTPLENSIFGDVERGITILINGIRTNFGLFDRSNLSQFPVNPAEIDSIVISYKPTAYTGEFSSGVLIDIRTKKSTDGISFSATYATGNEAGDPGPYLYTEHYSENVDQFGPNTFFSSNYGSERFDFTFNFVDQVSPTTDPAVLQRVNNFVFQNYQVRYSGFSFHSSAKSGFGNHHFFSSFSKTGQAVVGFEYGDDLVFINELSKEIPYRNENFIVSSGNNFQISPDGDLIVDVNLNHNSINPSKYSIEDNFYSDDLWMYSKIGYQSSICSIKYLAGASLTYHNMQNKITDFNYTRFIPSVFTSLSTESMKNLTTKIDAVLRYGENYSGIFICTDNELIVNEEHRLSFSVSYDNLFDIQNSLPYRIGKGYTFSNNNNNSLYSENPKTSQTLLNISHSFHPGESTLIINEMDINYFNKLSYILNDFVYYPDRREIVNEKSELSESINGYTVSYNISVTNKISSKLIQKFYYRYHSAFSDKEIFEDVMKKMPRHKLFYSIYYFPFKDITASLVLNYNTSTKWIEYRNIEEGSNNRYLFKLPDLLLVNCAVTKKFWSDRIRVSAVIHNLLNKRVQYHPVGGTFDITFFIKAEAELQSIIRF